jgi:TonB family protein
MKICPKCQTKYDEDIIKFCTKDGTPLIEENPTFTAMPSQSSIDDIGEETLITINRPKIPAAPVMEEADEPAARVVIPIGEEKQQVVRPLEKPNYQQSAPRKSNTALIVFLTIFGTVGILGAVFGGWWLLSGRSGTAANTNGNSNAAVNNSNQNVNYNSNLSDFNINNSNTNLNANSNVNANANKPTPTKTPTPKIDNSNTNVNASPNVNFNSTIINITPSNTNTPANRPVSPTPSETLKPTPTKTPTPSPANVNVGVMNSRASSLAKPTYPPAAKQMGASGQVVVQISVDENGNVLSARAISGHALLRNSAESAARQSRFNPVKIDDRPVRANGTLVYNFINQ